MANNIDKIELDELKSQVDSGGNNLVGTDMSLIGHVDVNVEVKIGNIKISVDKLFSMKKGEVIKMNESLDSPITLLVSGKPVAAGNLVAVDDNFGIEITEISKQ